MTFKNAWYNWIPKPNERRGFKLPNFLRSTQGNSCDEFMEHAIFSASRLARLNESPAPTGGEVEPKRGSRSPAGRAAIRPANRMLKMALVHIMFPSVEEATKQSLMVAEAPPLATVPTTEVRNPHLRILRVSSLR